jgi:hypothetical protein
MNDKHAFDEIVYRIAKKRYHRFLFRTLIIIKASHVVLLGLVA